MGYKITNPTTGVWHYEYALYNQNLDRAIQSFSVPLGAGVNISNIGFHAPLQHPGWAHDGTLNDAGFSSQPWAVTQASDSITWNSETFAQNQNANAIRWGTLYNLDRAIQSFSVPLGAGVNISNIGFHAPLQHPGWAHDGTLNDAGFSSQPWAVTQASDSITWNSETFAQNQNANAIRWGTLYN